jgi:hypothetical protein
MPKKLTYIARTIDDQYHIGTRDTIAEVFSQFNDLKPVQSYVLEGDVEKMVKDVGVKKVYNLCKILRYSFI